VKNTLKFFFSILGYVINKKKDYLKIINLNDWLPYKNKNEIYKIYYKGLNKSKEFWADFFSKQLRVYSLVQLVNKVLKQEKIYDFVECGCWRGHSSYIIANLIIKKKKNIKFHIFDSFEGLSPSDKNDGFFYKQSSEYKSKLTEHFRSSEDFLRNDVLKNFNFVRTYRGWIPSRFNEIKNNKFSFVHIDVDLYKPTIDTLDFFFPKLVKGGIIVCDDYNSSQFPGATKAWDQYFKKKNYNFFYEQPFGGCFIIK